MGDPVTGRVAQFREAPGVISKEAFLDYNSDINAPLNNPSEHLDKLDFHTDFDLLEIGFDQSVMVAHATVSSVSAPSGVGISAAFGFNDAPAVHTLFAHNLGYVPHAMVSVGDRVLYPGMPVQVHVSGSTRFATLFVDDTNVGIYETSSVGTSSLPALDLEYRVLIFKKPPEPNGSVLFEYNPETGEVSMGFGRFSSKRKYLQVVPGGSPLSLTYGRSTHLNNGCPSYTLAGGGFYNPVPVGTKFRIFGAYTGSFGGDSSYNGAFDAPELIQVQPPVPAALGQPNAFTNENGQFSIVDAGYVVSPANGKMINLLQTPVFDDTINVSFPDFSKGIFYAWHWQSAYNGFNKAYAWGNDGASFVTVTPQEWSDTIVLGPAPVGADLFLCRVRISRTKSPSHSWSGQSVGVHQPQDVWLPLNGTIVVEREVAPMMARAFSLYIENGNLVLHRQQSVGAATGGYGPFGNGGSIPTSQSGSGALSYGATSGVPVLKIQGRVSSGVKYGTFPPTSQITQHRWDGSARCSTGDPTNYSSEYLVEVFGQFGSRSITI